MAGLCAPLSTLRRCPRGHLRMTRGRCGSLLLHRDGLAPSTPCRSPGALRSTPESRRFQSRSACLKGATLPPSVSPSNSKIRRLTSLAPLEELASSRSSHQKDGHLHRCVPLNESVRKPQSIVY